MEDIIEQALENPEASLNAAKVGFGYSAGILAGKGKSALREKVDGNAEEGFSKYTNYGGATLAGLFETVESSAQFNQDTMMEELGEGSLTYASFQAGKYVGDQ